MPFTPIKEESFQPELTTGQKLAKGVSKVAPTTGAILGGIAGGLVGGIPGGAVGSAAGTGAGLALGESLENLTGIQEETQAELAKEAVTEPAISGILDLLTAGTVKVAGKTLGPLGRALKGTAKGVGRVFVPKNASTKAFSSIFKTSSRVAQELKPDEVAEEMIKHGFSGDLDDLANIADNVSGGEGIISKITRNAVGDIKKPIDIGNALSAAKKASDDAVNVDSKTLKKIQTGISNILSKNIGEKGSVSGVNALDALDAQRSLENIGYSLLNKAQRSADGLSAEVLEQQAKIYLSSASEIADAIDNISVGSLVDSFKTPQILNELRAISPRLAEQFSKVKNISEIRSIAKPFVRMSKLIDATKSYSSSAFIEGLKGRGIGEVLTGAITRPEAATSFALAGREISESPIGQGVKAIGQGAEKLSEVGQKITPSTMRILTQLGLIPSRED